jgi:prephenate dehydrogenase
MRPAEDTASAVVIGAGLIGTSVALALRGRGARVWLADKDPAAAQLAEPIGAGTVLPAGELPDGPADVAVLAVPPRGFEGSAEGRHFGAGDAATQSK